MSIGIEKLQRPVKPNYEIEQLAGVMKAHQIKPFNTETWNVPLFAHTELQSVAFDGLREAIAARRKIIENMPDSFHVGTQVAVEEIYIKERGDTLAALLGDNPVLRQERQAAIEVLGGYGLELLRNDAFLFAVNLGKAKPHLKGLNMTNVFGHILGEQIHLQPGTISISDNSAGKSRSSFPQYRRS